MFPTISLGRIAGIRVGIGWSWLLILGLIAWSLAHTVFPREDPHLSRATYAAMGIVAAFLYLASILLHELGHALQARSEGVETDGITLWLLGGVSRSAATSRRPAPSSGRLPPALSSRSLSAGSSSASPRLSARRSRWRP